MSRTTDAFIDHLNSLEGFEEWWDEHRRKIDEQELQQMYEEQFMRGKRA